MGKRRGKPMKSVAILTNEVMAYRKPVFDGLAERYAVTVFHAGTPSATGAERYAEVVLPSVRRSGFTWVRGLRRHRPERCDAVVAMFDLAWPQYLAPLLRRRRARWILWGHGYGRSGVGNALRDRLARRADAVLLYGMRGAREMAARGMDPARIFVAQNTVHVANSADLSDRPKSGLLFVGRLQARKRVDALIAAFARAVPRLPAQAHLDIVGDGEQRAALEACARRTGVAGRIRFHGDVRDEDALIGFFARAYAYVAAGHIGLAALHSLAYGVPVVVGAGERHAPEFADLQDGCNALFYRDRDDLEQTLIALCADPQRAQRLGRNAYRFYSRERTLDAMLGGFRRAIEGD